jgi:hypothetical protein
MSSLVATVLVLSTWRATFELPVMPSVLNKAATPKNISTATTMAIGQKYLYLVS